MKIFAPFRKMEARDDGTIVVAGIASTETVDADGEIIKASAIAAALPDFMRHGTGALREMHQLSAAGTVTSLDVQGGETLIEAHVVDPVAVKKVQAGVYKGFSVGGKVTARDGKMQKMITGVKLVEISLVDRPNNPDAVLTFWKVEADGAETVPMNTMLDLPAAPMWQVERLARILAELSCLQQDAAWEAREGEAAAVPVELKTAVGSLATLLSAMLASKPEPEPEAPVPSEGEMIAAAAGIDLAKVEAMIARALAPLAGQNELLKAEIAALRTEPLPAKAVLRVVGKTGDGGVADVGFEPVRNADGSINEPATEMKKVHAAGPVRRG